MEYQIINDLIRKVQALIMNREAGLETRSRRLEILEEFLEDAKRAIRNLQEAQCPRCGHERFDGMCACAGHGGG